MKSQVNFYDEVMKPYRLWHACPGPLSLDERAVPEKGTPDPDRPLSPGRVRRGFRNIHRDLGSPARVPKPARPGPGRPKGSGMAPHHGTFSPARPTCHALHTRRRTGKG